MDSGAAGALAAAPPWPGEGRSVRASRGAQAENDTTASASGIAYRRSLRTRILIEVFTVRPSNAHPNPRWRRAGNV